MVELPLVSVLVKVDVLTADSLPEPDTEPVAEADVEPLPPVAKMVVEPTVLMMVLPPEVMVDRIGDVVMAEDPYNHPRVRVAESMHMGSQLTPPAPPEVTVAAPLLLLPEPPRAF